jgi:hypothetical protein
MITNRTTARPLLIAVALAAATLAACGTSRNDDTAPTAVAPSSAPADSAVENFEGDPFEGEGESDAGATAVVTACYVKNYGDVMVSPYAEVLFTNTSDTPGTFEADVRFTVGTEVIGAPSASSALIDPGQTNVGGVAGGDGTTIDKCEVTGVRRVER